MYPSLCKSAAFYSLHDKLFQVAFFTITQEPGWTENFETYLKDVMCPFSSKDKMSVLDWLLGLAVRLEFGDNGG